MSASIRIQAGVTRLTGVLALIALTAWVAQAQPSEEEGQGTPVMQTLTFGIIPQQSAQKLARLWTPILERISRESGVKIAFMTAKNIPTFEQRLSEGKYDIAYMNPYQYPRYHDMIGYLPLVKAKNKLIKGIVVVRNDSPLTSLEALKGSEVAFPSPNAFGASILTRFAFKASGTDIIPVYVSTHDSVYRNVAAGRIKAGGGVLRTFNSVAPEVKDRLKIIFTTKGYTPHAIAVLPEVPQEIAETIQKALINLESDEAGASLLKNLNIVGFEAATDSDWDDVRLFDINELQVQDLQ
jgi:phosphonate transport system substrate-binding protein